MQRNSNFEERGYNTLWTHKGNKFVIGTVTGEPRQIVAQYNPKELSRTASAAWNTHPNTSARQAKSGETLQWMEYGTSEPRTVTLELLFDGYEEGISIAPNVADLESLTLPKDRRSREEEDHHPQLCVAVWGTQQLRCVVISVATKLTMFDASGEPLRATCSVTLKEVDVIAMMKAGDKGFNERASAAHKASGVEIHARRRHWTDSRQLVDAFANDNLRKAKVESARIAAASASEPAWTPPPPKASKLVERTKIENVEDEDDQDLADNQALQAQNEQDARDDAAADAADEQRAQASAQASAPKPTATTPEGTYEVGTPSEKADPNTIESNPPTAYEPATHLTPAGTYAVGTPSEKADPNTLESHEPHSRAPRQDELDDLE